MFVCPACAASYPAKVACEHDGAMTQSNADDGLLGSTLGSYRIAAQIGAGGMGAVYRAVHPDIGSRVAIKVLSHDSARDASIVNRFFDEARAVNLIRHENIVEILDLARLPDGRPYIVMEYLDGAPLAHMLESGPLPVARAVAILSAILDALQAAHSRDILHRDLKPDNVMISPTSRVTLVDFGIAKIMSNDATRSRTATGAVLGTPHYMSPEQALSRPLDARSDIYSAGVVLYHMVTGHRPFEGDSLFEVLRFQIEKAPVAPSELVELPADLEQIIMVAMAKPAEQRFASAAAMQLSLRQLQLDASWDVPRVKPGHLPPQLVLSGPTMAMDASQRPMVSAGVTTVLPTAATPTGAAPPAIAQTFQVASPIGKSSGGRTKVMLLVGAVLAAGGVAAFTFGPHADKPASATPPPAPALTLRSAEEAMVALQSKDPAKVAEANRVIQGDIDKASPFVASAGSAEVQVDGFLPYAVNAAHAVAPDAEFIALEFTDITKTGTITPGIGFSMASARFFSPALHVRPPDVKADAHWSPLSTIVVNVDFVGTRVMRIANEIRLPTLALPKCKASQLWQRASAVGAKPDAPAQTYQFSAATGGRWEWWGDQARQFADDCD